jgi:hypothetical protein
MPVPELEILIATTKWPWRRGAVPRRLSISSRSNAGMASDLENLRRAFIDCRIPDGWWNASNGPDLIAASSTEIWEVECKGEGDGVQQTQRNNFDRALASVVSYYGGSGAIDSLPENATTYLCLALPRTRHYCQQLRRRVRRPLRERLNLWILLYDSATKEVHAVMPNEEYSL